MTALSVGHICLTACALILAAEAFFSPTGGTKKNVERIIVVRISMAVPVMEVTADGWIKGVFQ